MSLQSEIEVLSNNLTEAYAVVGTKGGTIPTDKNTENLADAIDSISGGTVVLGVVDTSVAQELGMPNDIVAAVNEEALSYASVSQADMENAEHFSFEDGYWYYDGEKIEDPHTGYGPKLVDANVLPKMVGTTENFRAETVCKLNAVMIDAEVGSSTNFDEAFQGDSPWGMMSEESNGKLGLVYARIAGDGSNVSSMQSTFQYQGKLRKCELPPSMPSLKNTNCMFHYCSSIPMVDTTPFTAVDDAQEMFSYCYSLASIDTTPFTSLTNARQMFNQCKSLTTINTAPFTNVTNAQGMLQGCAGLTSVDASKMTAVTNAAYMFSGCHDLTSVDISGMTKVTNTDRMFCDCYSLASIDTAPLANSTNGNCMFAGCKSLTEVDISNMKSLTTTSAMFSPCTSLTSVNVSGLDKVTDVQSMFQGCTALTSVDASGMSAVTRISNMFNGCTALTSVDLSGATAATDAYALFSGCTSLASVDLSDTNLNQIKSYDYMFRSVPTTCHIIVKDQTSKNWMTSKFPAYTNVTIKGEE